MDDPSQIKIQCLFFEATKMGDDYLLIYIVVVIIIIVIKIVFWYQLQQHIFHDYCSRKLDRFKVHKNSL